MIKRVFTGISVAIITMTFANIMFAKGDVKIGKNKYKVCIACHGADGGGIKVTNAPRLSGQEPWYLKRQLYNFKNGIRGSHLNDITGMQMRTMAISLSTEQDIEMRSRDRENELRNRNQAQRDAEEQEQMEQE